VVKTTGRWSYKETQRRTKDHFAEGIVKIKPMSLNSSRDTAQSTAVQEAVNVNIVCKESTQLSAEEEKHTHGIGRSNQYYKIPARRKKCLDKGIETARRLSTLRATACLYTRSGTEVHQHTLRNIGKGQSALYPCL
jgi:hypothetical protein